MDWNKYRLLREHWTHEDDLINHRVSWLILSQGLLFASYSIFIQLPAPQYTAKVQYLVKYLPLMGLGISLFFTYGIYAALSAMDDIKDRYQCSGFDESLAPLYPSKSRLFQGKLPARIMPFLFVILWLIALLP